MNTSHPHSRGSMAYGWKRKAALSTTLLAGLISQAYAQQAAAPAAPAQPDQKLETVVVSGYAASLASAAKDKRNAVGFVDTVSAEDIGKFPDANIAESLARIPGVQVSRDISGEGVNIQVRGLGSSFTKMTLNGQSLAVASASLDAQNVNREVDLDLMPADLFSKLTVYKSPNASLIEGGSAGTVDMRSVRAYDNPGQHLIGSYSGTDNTVAGKWGHKGLLIASTTLPSGFGLLVGVSFADNKVRTTGFESVGWTNPQLSALQNTGSAINTTGGGNWTIPSTVPANAGNGLTTGAAVNQAFLLANNPGLSITQIDNALVPRLGRHMDQSGDRKRLSGVINAEYRPNSDVSFYLDTLIARKDNDLRRIDMNWAVRNGASIPLNMQVDGACTNGCVVTKGTFANTQYFLEYRPVIETTKLWNMNPGMEWKISDRLKFDAQANASRGTYKREAPTVLVATAPNSGVTVNYDNTSGDIPTFTSNVDVNNASAFGWNGGRVNVQDEYRTTKTKGARANLLWGDDLFSIKGGIASDQISRDIRATDNSGAWQAAVCGNNPTVWLPSPNGAPGCTGNSTPGTNSGLYPAYGQGATAGKTGPILNQGSLVPSSALASYLVPGPAGFITVDWNRFSKDTNYGQYEATALPVTSSASGASVGSILEKATGFYLETAGSTKLFGNQLRYDAGVRYVHTEQTITGVSSTPADPRNAGADGVVGTADDLGDGARYPALINWVSIPSSYNNTLPSGSLAYNLTDSFVLRTSASKTMTRANPNAMLPGVNFSDPSAASGSLGNTKLKPYLSKNLDLGLDWYNGREGYVSLTHFEKQISGFTQTANITMPFSALAPYGVTYGSITGQQQAAIDARGGANAATVIMSQQVNVDGDLNIHGTELGIQQSLDRWLPIKGFGFTGNITYVKQNSKVPGAVALGVPKITNNLTVYYEHAGYMVRLSQNYSQGSQVAGNNQNGVAAAALFVDPYKRLDLSMRFDLETILNVDHAPQLSIDVGNLTKESQRTYFQFQNATYSEYKPGRVVTVGLRMQF